MVVLEDEAVFADAAGAVNPVSGRRQLLDGAATMSLSSWDQRVAKGR